MKHMVISAHNPHKEPLAAREVERDNKDNHAVLILRWLLKPLGWPTHSLSVIATLGSLWAATTLWADFGFSLCIIALWSGIALIWMGRIAIRCIVALCSRRLKAQCGTGWKNWLVAPLLLGCVWLLSVVEIPLTAAFSMSRPAMDHVARQALAAPDSRQPDQWAGLYKARSIAVVKGRVEFVVVYSGFMAQENFGFAYSPHYTPPDRGNGASSDSYRRLSDGWYLWQHSED
jgi:hypothetical protein